MLLGIDVGGTFTDAVLVDADGRVHTAKVPSTPSQESAGVIEAVRRVLAGAQTPAGQVARFAHGMTVATNALLEGRTARTALLATEGFTDVLELGRQAREHLYDLCRAAPPPLAPRELRFPAPERMGADGVLRALERPAARVLVEALARAEPEAVAVSLLHSYADPAHEQMLGELLRELLPDTHVALSHELVNTFREFERTATTVLDAALSPPLGAYLEQLTGESQALGLAPPLVMQSSGGLTEAAHAARHAALTVLSGPAGGVGGALMLAALAGRERVVCFDMGGTSCDVCVIDGGEVAETAERTIAGRPLALPALDIHTVGAGGGSIAWRDPGGALRVGPQSAGARPGPACYGLGGELPTVTDANLLLGRLPAGAPLAGGLRLDRAAAERAVAALALELELELLDCAEGILRVAEAEMLGALRLMTVERGVDPRGFALMPFGGAGPLHAAAMARRLEIEEILCPGVSGVLSALGLAAAAPRRDAARTVLLSGASLSGSRLASARRALLETACTALGSDPSRVRVRHELRYRGQSFELAVEERADGPPASWEQVRWLDPDGLRDAFAAAHERRYGFRDDSAEVELVNVRVSSWGAATPLQPRPPAVGEPEAGTGELVLAGRTVEAPVLRGELPAGTSLVGPVLCAMPHATLLVPPGWAGEVDAHGTARLAWQGADGEA